MLKKLLLVVIFLLSNNLFAQTATAPSGTGTAGDPYLIATLDNLYWVTQNSPEWSKVYKQTADINASSSSTWAGGAGFSPIGNSSTRFTGSYDGNGYVITGVKINRSTTSSQAVFGYIYTAVIKNLGVTNVNITGQYSVGGLIGVSNGGDSVYNCFTSGTVAATVSGYVRSGGLIGELGNSSSSFVSNCYSTASVTGQSIVGGLIGQIFNGSTVNYCYSTGLVSGTSYLGGLIGFINSGTVSNSYWDTQTSNQPSSAGGTGVTGKNTTEMQTQSTYTGWDFTNTWSISGSVNSGYPYLRVISSLPVELTSFTAAVYGSSVNLKWQTATEVQNYGFEVQRSAAEGEPRQGREARGQRSEVSNWEKIGFVAGAGNSNSPKYYSFTDQPTGGTSFSYRLKQIDNDGHYKYYDAITVTLRSSGKAELMQNSPNPFNPTTAIKFFIPNSSDVTIKIYDMLGREVTTLINNQTEAGYHIVYWNGRDSYGRDAASGVYLYRLTVENLGGSRTGSFSETKKMNLLK